MSAETIKDGGHAFPPGIAVDHAGDTYHGPYGMSLRDWFAGQIINGIVSNREQWLAYMADRGAIPAETYVAEVSYDLADAMLKAREAQS